MSFWDAIEQHVADLDGSAGADGTEAAPDPWAMVEVDDAGLTQAQIALLADIDDQPPVPHLGSDDLPRE